jgi:hypothetical protein
VVAVDHRHQGDRAPVQDDLAIRRRTIRQPNRLQRQVHLPAPEHDPTSTQRIIIGHGATLRIRKSEMPEFEISNLIFAISNGS